MLRSIMIRKKIDDANKALEQLRTKKEQFATREADLETAIQEAETDEEKAAVEEEVEKFETEKKEVEEKEGNLQREVENLEAELEKAEEEQRTALKAKEEEKKMPGTRNDNSAEQIRAERQAFANYVRGIVTRDDYNMEVGNNGAVIPKTIAQEIITKVKEICPIYDRATRYNVKGNLSVPFTPKSADHQFSMAYAAEFTDLTAASADFGDVELKGFLAGALAKISKSLVNNAAVDIVPFVVEELAKAYASWIENECINGTTNKITGLSTASQSVTAAAKSSITADELIDLQSKVPSVYRKNAFFIMNPKTLTAVRKLKDNEGRYIFNPDAREGFGGTILGSPVFESANCPEMGTANKKAVFFVDASGLGVKLSEDLEIQVLLEKFATQHAIGVVGWAEVDAKIVNDQKVAYIKMGTTDPT